MTEQAQAQRRVLICGDRNWSDPKMVLMFVKTLPRDTIIIEGEAQGADSHAREAAKFYALTWLPFPARWDLYGRAAGPIRNRQMLDEGRPDEVHAFHDNLYSSKGTLNMLKQARKRGVRCWLHFHDGVTEIV